MPSASAGDTYSFGVAGTNAVTDRALGTLLTGSLTSTIGATFTNNTGSTITSLDIAYRGELWRLGTAGRTDELDFQRSTDATALNTGTWSATSALNFLTPNTTGSAGARDGNASGNFSNLSTSITGLSIANGATFWIRWVDIDATSSDDGLAVDDFSLTPHGSASSIWSGAGANNNWSSSANWNAAPTNGSSVVFAGTTRLSNSNDTLTNVGSITFDSTAGAFSLSGNAITIAGGITNNSANAQTINLNHTLGAAQQINAAAGNLAINGSVANGGNLLTITGASNTTLAGTVSGVGALVKTGTGTLTLSGNNTYSGGTTIAAGSLLIGHVHGLGTGGLTLTGSATASLQSGLSSAVVLPSLSINGGTAVPTGTFNITDNKVILSNANTTAANATHTTITQQILHAFNNFAWDQPGITSLTVQNDVNVNGALTAIGLMLNNDGGGGNLYGDLNGTTQFGGQTTDANSVLLRYTYLGDLNLDGVVNGNDFNLFALGASGGAPQIDWVWGDVNYDGVIDGNDFNLFALGFSANAGQPNISSAIAPQPVPEPAAFGMAVVASICVAIRQRKRSSKVAAICLY